MEIKIDLTWLREWQKEVFNEFKRFNILVIHRRAGKTITAICLLIYKALQNKGNYGYIAPTYKQSKAIAFDYLTKFAKKIPNSKVNISELTIELVNGSKIRLFGADNPDSLRGLDLQGVVFDEYSQQPSSIYGEIVFPMINANMGWCLWIGTPKGKNAFYQLYQKGLKDDKYYTKLLTVGQTKLLNEEQLKQAREEMTEEEYEQEYNCSWTANIRGAVYGKELSKMYDEGRVKEGLYDPNLQVYTFWDLGISDKMAILFVQIIQNEIRIIDNYSNSGYSLEHYINFVKERGYKYNTHYFPHDIRVRELSSGMSRLDIVSRMLTGFGNIKIVTQNTIEGGINAGRIIFKNVWIDESLIDLLNDLSLYQYEFDDKLGEYKKIPKHDFTSHNADCYRYLAITFYELTNITEDTRYEMKDKEEEREHGLPKDFYKGSEFWIDEEEVIKLDPYEDLFK